MPVFPGCQPTVYGGELPHIRLITDGSYPAAIRQVVFICSCGSPQTTRVRWCNRQGLNLRSSAYEAGALTMLDDGCISPVFPGCQSQKRRKGIWGYLTNTYIARAHWSDGQESNPPDVLAARFWLIS